MLEIRNLSKRFGGLVATNNVSITVDAGSISALIGPNGAGKTTIFAQISGFHRPDSGDIRFEGQSLLGLLPERICLLGIARTFQIVQPFAGLNVRENIAVGAHLHRASRRAALEHADAIAHRVGLGAQLDKPAAALTVAGRKRLELAKALATDPKLLLLDEVMAGLNPAEIDEIIPIIRGIRQSGVTILLIEHVMRAVMNLSDHAWVLNNGTLIASGTPSQIASNPKVIEAYLGHGAAARMQEQAGGARHA
ncbi:MAG TPA: ABC transporter ATP-binding protein [Ferrovibrio sp.]|jgi:branched-chain amino acid transport system ATP-binding protein|uniref:ABC transporter ATP-binding protein n=1 Tax=Ferrovibrio sp. TaxID=1917215 RepID=UPI002B4AC893|nr:ABC transporter ATP-binding protein [Ferrovibrio sp.]HLT76171.1 ABC transporter ATP-binding protein [Ferrovibrio sp.]